MVEAMKSGASLSHRRRSRELPALALPGTGSGRRLAAARSRLGYRLSRTAPAARLERGPMNLGRFPRIRFAHLPTPLEHLPNLTRALSGPEIWIKRDDCTGVSTGGNKTRKLEFLLRGSAATEKPTYLSATHRTAKAAFGELARQSARDRPVKCLGDCCFLDFLPGASVEPGGDPDMNAELACVRHGADLVILPDVRGRIDPDPCRRLVQRRASDHW